MKHFRSELNFQKYKPHVGKRGGIFRFFKKRNKFYSPEIGSSYRGNPYKIKKKSYSLFIKLAAVFMLIILWAALMAYLPYFKIQKIATRGLKNISELEISTSIEAEFLQTKYFVPHGNYFLIKPSKIADYIREKFTVEKIAVSKVFPNELYIELTEKVSSLIYDDGSKYYLLDKTGSVIKFLADVDVSEIATTTVTSAIIAPTNAIINATSTATGTIHMPNYKKIAKLFGDYPIVYDAREINKPKLNENVLPANIIASIILWDAELPKQGIGEVKYFKIQNINAGVMVDTIKSWDIYFQPNVDHLFQINNLKNIIKTIKPRYYVDLRFGNKVYWK